MTAIDESPIDLEELEMDPRFEERRAEVEVVRWGLLRRRLATVGGVVLCCLALIGAVYSPLLDIDQVDVYGADSLPADQLLADADINVGDPIVFASPGEIATRLEALPDVARASVTRRWPSTLDVRVTQREAVAEFRSPDGVSLRVGNDAVVLPETTAVPGSLPVVAVAESLDPTAAELPAVVAEFARVVALMPSSVSAVVESMIVGADGQLLLNLESGAQVKFGDHELPERKFASLSTTLGGQVDVEGVCTIDVRLVSPVTMMRGAACRQ